MAQLCKTARNVERGQNHFSYNTKNHVLIALKHVLEDTVLNQFLGEGPRDPPLLWGVFHAAHTRRQCLVHPIIMDAAAVELHTGASPGVSYAPGCKTSGWLL